MPTKVTGTFSNVGSPAPDGNFGPFNLPAVNKLIAARVRIHSDSQFAPFGSSTTVLNGTILGIQVQFQGDPPFNLPAQASAVNFLSTTPIGEGAFPIAWAPSTDTASVGGVSTTSFEWHGQKFFGADLDFYITWSSTVGLINQEYDGHFEVIYS